MGYMAWLVCPVSIKSCLRPISSSVQAASLVARTSMFRIAGPRACPAAETGITVSPCELKQTAWTASLAGMQASSFARAMTTLRKVLAFSSAKPGRGQCGA